MVEEEQQGLQQIQYASMYNRTFGKNGNIIQVYQNDEDQLKHIINLPTIQEQDEEIQTKSIMLFDNDTKFLLVDQNDKTHIYNYDITKGKVIDKITGDGYNSISQISYKEKNQDRTSN